MENEGRPPDAAVATAAPATASATPSRGNPVEDSAPAAWEVLARFRSTVALNRAVKQLEASGFDHGSLGMPEVNPPEKRATPEAGSEEIATDTGAQQSRIVHVAVAGAIAAMIGALIAATQRGGMVAIAASAIGAGIVVAVLAEIIVRALGRSGQQTRERLATEGRLVLAVRTDSAERRERALGVLRETGGELL